MQTGFSGPLARRRLLAALKAHHGRRASCRVAMVLTVDGCGNCSSAAWRYLDSMLHREPSTDTRQCRSTHHYIRGPLARLDIAHAAAANAASRKPLQAKAAINISALQAPECFCHLHSGLPPPLARPQRAAKLRSGSMVCGKEDWGDWPAWRDKKTGQSEKPVAILAIIV